MSEDQVKGSLLQTANSDDDVQPQDLSGDQNAQRSLIMSDITGAKANFLLTVTTIMKTVIGAGILSLPYTTSRLGYVLAVIMFVIIITLIQFSAVLLLKAKNLSRHSNYTSIGYHIFRSRIAHVICALAILVNNIGVCIIELTIIKQLLRSVIISYIDDVEIHDKFYLNTAFIVLVAALLEMPLTFVKKIEKLKLFAFSGVLGITVFVASLTITFFAELSEGTRDWSCHVEMQPFAKNAFNIAIVIPNMMLALAYQMNFFPIYKGMSDARDEKMAKASITGVLACSFFYILVGNMGYCLFGNELGGNFLLSFTRAETNQALYLLMNIGFLISVFFSFPIMFFGARNNFISLIKNLVFMISKKKDESQRSPKKDALEEISSYIETEDKAKRKKQAKILFVVYTIVLFAFAAGVAAAVDDIEDVFNVVGAIASNAIAFIFPNMFYVLLIRKKNKPRKIQYYVSFALFVFFIPFGIFSVVSKFLADDAHH